MSYWANIDVPTKSYKIHKVTCRYCQPVETPLKGVNFLKIDGGWIKFDDKKEVKQHWKKNHRNLDWAPCKVCNP